MNDVKTIKIDGAEYWQCPSTAGGAELVPVNRIAEYFGADFQLLDRCRDFVVLQHATVLDVNAWAVTNGLSNDEMRGAQRLVGRWFEFQAKRIDGRNAPIRYR